MIEKVAANPGRETAVLWLSYLAVLTLPVGVLLAGRGGLPHPAATATGVFVVAHILGAILLAAALRTVIPGLGRAGPRGVPAPASGVRSVRPEPPARRRGMGARRAGARGYSPCGDSQ
jgi:hypothetical protein